MTLSEVLIQMAGAIQAAANKSVDAIIKVDANAKELPNIGIWSVSQYLKFVSMPEAERVAYYAKGQPFFDYENVKGLPGEVAQKVVDETKVAAIAAAALVPNPLSALTSLIGLGIGGWLLIQILKK